jgi:hypothetical protein
MNLCACVSFSLIYSETKKIFSFTSRKNDYFLFFSSHQYEHEMETKWIDYCWRNKLNQLSRPQGIYVDDDNQCIYIADYDNHRIVQ